MDSLKVEQKVFVEWSVCTLLLSHAGETRNTSTESTAVTIEDPD